MTAVCVMYGTVVGSRQHCKWFRSFGENYFLDQTQNSLGCYGDIHTKTTPNTECDLIDFRTNKPNGQQRTRQRQ